MKYNNINEAISDNSSRQCKVRNCYNPRSRISGYCKQHTTTNQNFGHPEHRKIIPKHYKYEREECRKVIEGNIGHDGIKRAIAFLDGWLDRAGSGKPTVLGTHFSRLKRNGVTGKDILIECCAIWLFADWNPNRIFDHKHLTYAIGNRVLRVSPYSYKTTGPEHRTVGKYILENVGVLMVSVTRKINKLLEEGRLTAEAMAEPLS